MSAGCEVGRLILSVWRLVYFEVDERAWHMTNNFGASFFELTWQPHPPWPLFRALSRLHRRILGDPEGTYPRGVCDSLGVSRANAEEEELLLAELASGSRAPVVPALAAQFLLGADRDSACPLAVAGAFWSLAASLSRARGSSAREEVLQLLERGERAGKSWRGERFPFLGLFTTQWPLWGLLAQVEETALFGEVGGPHGATPGPLPAAPSPPPAAAWRPHDPLEPACSRPDRLSLARGLEEQRVEAVIVFGRRDRVRVLHRYLLRNLRVNGGLLDRVSFVVFAAMADDLLFLQELVQAHAPYYDMPPVTGRRLAKIYSICRDPDTVYIKIDDDIVYIADEAIPAMVRERLRGRCGVVSANVVNHAILSAVHQDVGAIRNFFPPEDPAGTGGASASPRAWVRADGQLPLAPVTKHAQSDCVWRLWECAAWMHESLLSRLADGTECAYDFGFHDFHAHGHGAYKGDKFLPLAYSRWSINMIALKAEDLTDADLSDLAEDDESELGVVAHHRMGKRACAVGRALVSHLSYSLQEDGLLENTDLLERYDALSRSLEEAEVGGQPADRRP
uniref:Uncharacterized protein n=1 Tax=Alexandrium monilatum TaxID=311494 RepID=A0A7S4R648_9DINO